jgi:hypothetical protein
MEYSHKDAIFVLDLLLRSIGNLDKIVHINFAQATYGWLVSPSHHEFSTGADSELPNDGPSRRYRCS